MPSTEASAVAVVQRASVVQRLVGLVRRLGRYPLLVNVAMFVVRFLILLAISVGTAKITMKILFKDEVGPHKKGDSNGVEKKMTARMKAKYEEKVAEHNKAGGKGTSPAKPVGFTKYEKAILRDITLPSELDVEFEDVGGLEDIKERLLETVILPLQNPEMLQRSVRGSGGRGDSKKHRSNLIRAPKGALFYGPPGTGKTLLAKAIAKSCGAAFINVRASTFQSKWHGDSCKMGYSYFSLARKLAPSILFVDEIDLTFENRLRGMGHGPTMSMSSEFIQEWEGVAGDTDRVVVLACSNNPSGIDPAVLRRLPAAFFFPIPDTAQERLKILEVLLRGFELADAANSPGLPAGEHVDLPALAEKVPRYTGSDLRELCRVACMSPAREFLKKNLSIRTEEGGEEKGKGQVSRVSSLLKRMVSSSGSSSSPDGEIQARPLQQKDFLEAMVNVKATAVNTSRYTAFKKKLFSANR